MFATTCINYVCGNIIYRAEGNEVTRKRALVVSVAASLALLGIFKYFGFLEVNLNFLLDTIGAPLIPVLQIALPAGISFYTFHCISYTVDIYRGEAAPVRRLSDFACFVALYPQLIAGPIHSGQGRQSLERQLMGRAGRGRGLGRGWGGRAGAAPGPQRGAGRGGAPRPPAPAPGGARPGGDRPPRRG